MQDWGRRSGCEPALRSSVGPAFVRRPSNLSAALGRREGVGHRIDVKKQKDKYWLTHSGPSYTMKTGSRIWTRVRLIVKHPSC